MRVSYIKAITDKRENYIDKTKNSRKKGAIVSLFLFLFCFHIMKIFANSLDNSELRKTRRIAGIIHAGRRLGRFSFMVLPIIILYLLGYHSLKLFLRGIVGMYLLTGRNTYTRRVLYVPVATAALVIIVVLSYNEETQDSYIERAVNISSAESQVNDYKKSSDEEIMDVYLTLKKDNPDFAGWISINGTNIDYPVMYTPYDKDKYLHKHFDQQEDSAGTPFIEADCTLKPESDNIIIYGHNMKDGSMFSDLLKYADEDYYTEHKTINFDTVDCRHTYVVMSAFYDKVYYKDEDVFKFYKFIDSKNKTDYQNAIKEFKKKSIYKTDVNAAYGDKLITLVTCSYQTENGRFVVVAKEQDYGKDGILSVL